jgi:mRNA deadenylase 3'-5' endonuclease subunit Ccr4
VDARFHEPLFSIYTKDFKGTLDYILYTNNFLQVGDSRADHWACDKCGACESVTNVA